jgi:pimeloyl-ACP methyl ester carboxylesterase
MRRPRWKTVRLIWIVTGLVATVLFNGYMLLGRRATVGREVLDSSARITVSESRDSIRFAPRSGDRAAALLFFPGSAVDPRAYAPMCRAVAENGYEAVIVKMPFRWPLFESQKVETLRRALAVVSGSDRRWVVSGHSLGGAMAVRFAHEQPALTSALVLLGTTHPRDHDLSRATYPAAKVYGTNDRIAPAEKIEANRALMPPHTQWVRIEGGTHLQFGHYANQPGDGDPGISHEQQQAIVRETILAILQRLQSAPE